MSWSNWHQGIIYEGKKFQEHIKVQFYILKLFGHFWKFFMVKNIYKNEWNCHLLWSKWSILELNIFIIDCLISYHSICYTLWWWVIYFLTCPLLYIKLVQIVVKIFIYFWTICEEQTQFLYQGGRWMYFTHRMDW